MLKRQAGVSLVELLIGIAILAILISFGISSYRSWIQNSQIRNSAESVVNGLQLARAEALRRNAYVRFNLTDANSSAWTICIWDRTNNACSTATDATIQQYQPSEGSRNARGIGEMVDQFSSAGTEVILCRVHGVAGQSDLAHVPA